MATIPLTGKVALVTGAARRVGQTIALELARQGMRVAVHYHTSADAAQRTAEAIRAAGVEAETFQADLRQPDQIQAMFGQVEKRFGRLDLLVNNASIFHAGSLRDLPLAAWQESLEVNLTAPFLCSQQAAKLMGAAGGSIINIADGSGLRGWVGYPGHSVSKAGLLMLTEVLAKSLGPIIRVNAVVPGPVLRDESYSAEQWDRLAQRLPLARGGDPADVAQAVIFLASQPYITGEILRVDGGEYLK